MRARRNPSKGGIMGRSGRTINTNPKTETVERVEIGLVVRVDKDSTLIGLASSRRRLNISNRCINDILESADPVYVVFGGIEGTQVFKLDCMFGTIESIDDDGNFEISVHTVGKKRKIVCFSYLDLNNPIDVERFDRIKIFAEERGIGIERV